MGFTVYGIPRPGGSKRAIPYKAKGTGKLRVAVKEDSKFVKDWRAAVSSAAGEANRLGLLEGPLRLRLTFYLPRPQGHFGARGLLPSAPWRPVVRPDCLKLARAVEDALTGILWRDDSQIVDEELHKRYGEPARCEIRVEAL